MRCAIITLSTVHKHGGRLDAAYYLGIDHGADAALQRAKRDEEAARARVARLTAENEERRRRAAAMIEAGEVRPL